MLSLFCLNSQIIQPIQLFRQTMYDAGDKWLGEAASHPFSYLYIVR